MLPIPGETYQEYLDRVNAAGYAAYALDELLAMGWVEADGQLFNVQEVPGETPGAFGPEITEQPGAPGPEGEPEIITLVTIYFLVWCTDPDTGETVGPYTQMLDVDWYNIDILGIESQVDAAAKLFCQLASWRTSPRHVSTRDVQDYDWQIVSPFGLRYSHGI